MLVQLLKVGCTLLVSFAALVGIIRSQPESDSDLSTFLALSERCRTPCLLGLNPGYTHADAAVHVLEQNPWVRDLHSYASDGDGTGELVWNWNPSVPTVINADFPGRARILNGVITSIAVETHSQVGDWVLALGFAATRQEPRIGRQFNNVQFVPLGGGAHWAVSARVDCPISLEMYWLAPARLELSIPMVIGDWDFPPTPELRRLCARYNPN